MGDAAKNLDGAALKRLLSLVKTHTGITMEERKRDLLIGRVRPRLRVLGLESVDQYMDLVDRDKNEKQEFVNLVTTNETLFFRTQLIWDFFQRRFLPDWFKENPDSQLKVWSAASSSGEEACTIGMVCEEFRLHHPSFKYRIFGSDISTDVLEVARAGIYGGKSVDEFKAKSPIFFGKYFQALGDGRYKVSDAVTKNCEFGVHHLHQRPTKQAFFDIVFLRNVMIYFNDADQELVLKQVHTAMRPKAYLMIGESESLSRLKTQFVYESPLIYRRDK